MNYKISAKYIKSLNFEIPNPKAFLTLVKNISNYKINIDIKSNQFKDKIIEVEISLSLKPSESSFEKINTKIVYSAIVEIEGDLLNKDKLKQVILVKVPNDIYDDMRKIFIFIFEASGFKDIKIDKNVDFQKLYNLKNN
jgi:preprotein translocase subunit SecB|tara:strand:+ start:83 stop:499 length:417 start_codon:yes stop_codon:yes gene_type:complete